MSRLPFTLSVAVGLPLASALAILAPSFLSGYWVFVATSVYMYMVIALAINVITGFAGYPAFGNSVFFGLGAYQIAIISGSLGLPLVLGVLGAVLFSVVTVLVIGVPILRAKGHYFAIATVGLNEATKQIVANLDIAGASRGIAGPVLPYGIHALTLGFYYAMMLAFAVSLAGVIWIHRSSFGRALDAIRDNEQAAEAIGIDTVRIKTVAWAISAAMTSLVGSIWGVWIGFFEPQSAFDIMISIKGFIMMLLGGIGTVFGPLLGAVGLEMLSRTVWNAFFHLHRLVLGVLIVAVVLLIPDGLVPLWRRLMSSEQRMKPSWDKS